MQYMQMKQSGGACRSFEFTNNTPRPLVTHSFLSTSGVQRGLQNFQKDSGLPLPLVSIALKLFCFNAFDW